MRRVVLLIGNVPPREVLEQVLGPDVEIRELAQDLDAPRPLLAWGPPEIVDVGQVAPPIPDVELDRFLALPRKVARLMLDAERDVPVLLPAFDEYPPPSPPWPECHWPLPRCAPRAVPLHFWAAALRSWSSGAWDDVISCSTGSYATEIRR